MKIEHAGAVALWGDVSMRPEGETGIDQDPDAGLVGKAFDGVPYATLIVDQDGYVIRANKRAARLLWRLHEVNSSALKGRLLSETTNLPNDQLVTRLLQGVAKGSLDLPVLRYSTDNHGAVTKFRATMLNRSGPRFCILLSQDCLSQTARALTKLNATREEAKEREERLTQDAQRLADSLEQMETFTNAASHDLKAPLGNLRQLIDLFQTRFADQLPAGATRYLQMMNRAANDLNDLTLGLLNHAQATSAGLDMQEVSLDDAIDDVLVALDSELRDAGAEIERQKCDIAPRAEPMLVKSLLINLISNAIKYRSADRPLNLGVNVRHMGHWYELSIRDNGQGFGQDVAEMIFKPFTRLSASAPGTGIGLATCAEICRRHDWHISAQGEPDGGACFTIKMPVPLSLVSGSFAVA